MKKLLLLTGLFCTVVGVSAQVTLFYDVDHYAAFFINHSTRMAAETVLVSQTKEMKENTQKGNANMTQLLLAKEKVVESLTKVNELLKDGREVRHIIGLLTDILEEAGRIEALAAGDPALLVICQKAVGRVRLQAVELYGEIDRFIAREGVEAMMDYNSRDELLKHITQRLQLLRGTLFGLRRSLYWAQLNGSWRRLNPFRSWANQDRTIINRILANAKNL